MTDTPIQKHTYMPGLDGLRALAVFAVIAYHLNLPFAPGGFLGVTLFFVLSGYLITDLLLSEYRQTGKINFKSFFARRAKRLLPSVLFLLICLSAYVSVFHPELLTNFKSELLPAALFFSNWWYILTDVPYFGSYATPNLLTHFWSLAVEVQFYVVWPALLLLGHRFIKTKWILAAITAAMAVLSAMLMAILFQPGTDPSRVYYGTDTRAYSLLLGAFLAFIYPSAKMAQPKQNRTHRIITETVGFCSLAAVLFMTHYITQSDNFLYFGGMFVFSAVSALLIAAAVSPSSLVSKVFSWRPLRFIGQISYGVYLWHFPIIVLSNALVPRTRIHVGLTALQITASILLAAASYYFIENPIRRSTIITTLRNKNLKTFCTNCLRSTWRTKSAVLLIFTFMIISTVGFLSPQSVSASADTGLMALPSELVINPSEAPVTPTESSDVGPSPDGPTPTPPGVSPRPEPADITPPAVSSAVVSSDTENNINPSDTSGTADPSDSTENGSADELKPCSLNVTLIGDSVGIDIAPYLQAYFPNIYVDAKVSRQFSAAKSIAQELMAAGKLGPVVVIELGTNGMISESHMRALLDLLGPERKVVFVNIQVPRTWCEGNNEMLKTVCADYDNTIIADWYSASIDQNDYFYSDDVHPNEVGSPVLAKLIHHAIFEIQLNMPYISLD